MAFRSIRKAVRLAALATASLTALASQAHAQWGGGTVTPYYGNIRPFYGNLMPFYGNLRPFYGNLKPFYGNIRPFWGDMTAFWGDTSPFTATTSGAGSAFYGPTKSDPFWGSGYNNPYVHNPSPFVVYGQIGGFWSTEYSNWQKVQALWANASTTSDYASVAQQLQSLVINPAASFWGLAAERATNTRSFAAAFSNAALASMGVTFNSDGSINAQSLETISPTERAMFFLNFYDGLMSYSGTGHVDWWMAPTGWSPALAAQQTQLGTAPPVSIGMLDLLVSQNHNDARGTVVQYGSSVFGDGHGAAVGSLIMSPSDGSGIMGVMPSGSAVITVYDPYDSTGTTNWQDVGAGVDTLAAKYFRKGDGKEAGVMASAKALLGNLPAMPNSLFVNFAGPAKIAPAGANLGVINASLGEPGWTLSPGWNIALSSGSAKNSILVVAAGNEGVVQPWNIPWNFARNPTLLVVGSVGLDGTISNFSNTPGDACLTDTASGACDPLKNHFLVAPGELVLVSNGSGGISRQTGTSLAAPLVSGAIGLLEARWPWLSNYPNETAEIILQSATRIHSPGYSGPGPDPVYGWGELNIAASQAPLDWRKLLWFQGGGAGYVPASISQVVAQVQTGNQAAWNSSKLYYTALERVGNTYRDFEIPLGASLVGQSVASLAGQQLFQSYLNAPLRSWVAGGAPFAATRDYDPATASFVASSQPMGQLGDAQLRVRLTQATPVYGFVQYSLPVNMDFAVIGQRQTVQFGFGDGAAALTGQPGLAGGADFQIGRGGANPLLGLASGGAYANWRISLARKLTFSFGATDRYSVRDPQMLGVSEIAGGYDLPGEVYAANAQNFGLDYAAARDMILHVSVTRLRENTGLLGVQSLQAGALDNGSTSQAASLGFDLGLSPTVTLSGSATLANTTSGTGQALTTSPGGLTSTAAEIAVSKAGLFDRHDRLRLTLSKPMQVVAGQVQFTSLGVIDRSTGAFGQIVETASAANRTPFAAELFYGRMIDHGRAEASVFLRAGVNTDQFGLGPRNDYMVGYRYKMAF